jgi:hypothetical protein
MFEACGCRQQPRHLVLAQDHRQLAHVPHADQLTRQIGPVERLGKEEPQCRYDGIHGRRRHAQVTLLDLEAPNLLRRCCVGRAPEKRREPPDVANVVPMRLRTEAAYVHLVNETLA